MKRAWGTPLLLAVGGLVWLAGLAMVFFYAPTERTMGIVQRIFYVPVPSAWVAFLAFGLVALASVGYLWLRDPRLDAAAVAAAELGLLFTSAALITGALWGRLAWGAWWVWEPRLTLTLLLWFVYLGYFLVRTASESLDRARRLAAVVGIVGALDIPLIHLSVHWFRSQHPQPVILRPEGPHADPAMVETLLVCLLGLTLVFLGLLALRYRLERLQTPA